MVRAARATWLGETEGGGWGELVEELAVSDEELSTADIVSCEGGGEGVRVTRGGEEDEEERRCD